MENTEETTYFVEVTRTGWRTETFAVEASNQAEAEERALAMAPDRAFGTDDGSDYEVASITQRKP